MRDVDAEGPSLEVFIQNLPGNVYRRVRSPDGSYRFEYLSSGLFRQFEIDNERLLAQAPITFDWIHPDDRSRFVSDLEMSAATLSILDHRIRVIGTDGRVHWARGIGRPSRRPDGSIVWDGIVIDVTREVEAEAALRIAMAEADRAHAAAARVIADAAARLAAPLDGLRRLAADETAGNAREFAALVDDLESALADLTPDRLTNGETRPGREASLTGRQREVLGLLKRGLSNKAIAQKLSITPGTVKLHVAAILRATNARTRRHLASPAGRSARTSPDAERPV
jgi:DNA-binding CsgD family transcriptional regulator